MGLVEWNEPQFPRGGGMGIPVTLELASRLELAEAEWNRAKLGALMDNSNNSRGVKMETKSRMQSNGFSNGKQASGLTSYLHW
jgi:hypothetical protein